MGVRRPQRPGRSPRRWTAARRRTSRQCVAVCQTIAEAVRRADISLGEPSMLSGSPTTRSAGRHSRSSHPGPAARRAIPSRHGGEAVGEPHPRFRHRHADVLQTEVEHQGGHGSGVAGVDAEQPQIDAEVPGDAVQPQRQGTSKSTSRQPGAMRPCGILEFVFKLAGAPARVAERHQILPGTLLGRDSLEDFAAVGNRQALAGGFARLHATSSVCR